MYLNLLKSSSMRSNALASACCVGIVFTLLVSVSCAPKGSPVFSEMTVGTLTVDAFISRGTRFNVYCNNKWSAPETQQVVPAQRAKYSFPLPSQLQSLRLDPSEMAGSHIEIFSIVTHLPGMPKKTLPLADLPKFLKYHCNLKLQPNSVVIDAQGPEMYLMSTVDPAAYPAAK